METSIMVNSEMFEGSQVRFIEKNGKYYIPIVDIARSISYEKKDLMRIIETHEDMFINGKEIFPLESKGGIQPTICVNRDGVIALFMGINIKRIKDINRRNLIIKFRAWAIETLGKVMDNKLDEIQLPGEKAGQPTITLGNRVSDQLQIADAMAKYANVDRGIAASMALSKVEFDTGVDLAMWKNMVVKGKPNKRIGLLLVTEIGVMLGLGGNAGHSVNKILNKLGYVYWVGHWALTQKGETYAEAFPRTGITEGGKSWARYDIKWQPEIVEILRKHLYMDVPKPDQGLLTGYI